MITPKNARPGAGSDRYKAESGAVIDTHTGTVWYSHWKQWEAEAIAHAHNTGDWSRIILRAGQYVEGVKR